MNQNLQNPLQLHLNGILAATATLLLCLSTSESSAQTYAVLHHFAGGTNDGSGPRADLLVWSDRLYGTTAGGGINSWGTVFALNTDGSQYAVIHGFSFSEGWLPEGRLVLCGSALYGTTVRVSIAYRGVLFKLNPDGSDFEVLRTFTNAPSCCAPRGTLALSGSTLFGTTWIGGISNYGTVFRVNTDGSDLMVLRNFTYVDGANPYAGMILPGTTLYGTTSSGGASGNGTVFKLNTDGSGYTVLKSFGGADGQLPYAALTLSGDVLYGTTANGGLYGNGTVFRINTDGTGFAVLKHFNGSDGANPHGDLALLGAALYGTTATGGMWNLGTIFQINTDGTGFSVIKHFSGIDGANPNGGLALLGSSLYGTTVSGGLSNEGVVFSLMLAPPVAGKPFIKVIGDEVSEFPARRFLIWCSDPDNDPLNLTTVTSPSAMGAIVTLETNQVSYAPPAGFLGEDTFGYTITDGNSGLASGTASILVEPRTLAAATMLPPITLPGELQLNFTGFANLGYAVERAESLDGAWTAIGNVLTDDNGAATFTDHNPPAGNAFYRVVH
jgi:uncharacterized repeat protein (TIGR03803 family)